MSALDDRADHGIRVGVGAAAGRVVTDRPEAHHPLALVAVVDDGAVVQVAVELEALEADRYVGHDEQQRGLHHGVVAVGAGVSLDGYGAHKRAPFSPGAPAECRARVARGVWAGPCGPGRAGGVRQGAG